MQETGMSSFGFYLGVIYGTSRVMVADLLCNNRIGLYFFILCINMKYKISLFALFFALIYLYYFGIFQIKNNIIRAIKKMLRFPQNLRMKKGF